MTTVLADIVDPDLVAAEVAAGWITERRSGDLRVLNYSKRTGFARRWNAATRACRGLVIDDRDRVVCRPFEKFFNVSEHEALGIPLPDREPDVVTEKLDGSLLIVGNRDGAAFATTRGDPNSSQAAIGRAMLGGFVPLAGTTALFEVLAPETRVVVDYGWTRDLVLLAVLDNATGLPVPPDDDGWFGCRAPEAAWPLDDRPGRESEGVVLYWHPRVWVKAKRAEYVRLHRLLTGTTPRRVWEALREGTLEQLRADAPEEFLAWIDRQAGELVTQHASIVGEATGALAAFDRPDLDRAAFARLAKLEPHPHLLFALRDGKPIDRLAWDLVKPAGTGAFREDEA